MSIEQAASRAAQAIHPEPNGTTREGHVRRTMGALQDFAQAVRDDVLAEAQRLAHGQRVRDQVRSAIDPGEPFTVRDLTHPSQFAKYIPALDALVATGELRGHGGGVYSRPDPEVAADERREVPIATGDVFEMIPSGSRWEVAAGPDKTDAGGVWRLRSDGGRAWHETGANLLGGAWRRIVAASRPEAAASPDALCVFCDDPVRPLAPFVTWRSSPGGVHARHWHPGCFAEDQRSPWRRAPEPDDAKLAIAQGAADAAVERLAKIDAAARDVLACGAALTVNASEAFARLRAALDDT